MESKTKKTKVCHNRKIGGNMIPKKIETKLNKIEDLVGDLKFHIEQEIHNLNHAKERIEADLTQGFYFDGKNSYELVKKGKRIVRKKQ